MKSKLLRTIGLTLASIGWLPSAATAQTYYMRERLVPSGAPAAPAAPAKKAATSCQDFVQRRMQTGAGAPSGTAPGVLTYGSAHAFCLAQSAAAKTGGACVWRLDHAGNDFSVRFYPDADIQTTTTSTLYAAVCS